MNLRFVFSNRATFPVTKRGYQVPYCYICMWVYDQRKGMHAIKQGASLYLSLVRS